MKRISLLIVIIFILLGCSSAYDNHITEAEDALEKGDFETALTSYNAALEENPDSEDAETNITLLKNYEKLQGEMDDYEWTKAHDIANDILEHDNVPSPIHTAVKEAVTTIEKEKEHEEKISSKLKKLEKEIDNNQIDKAHEQLSKLAKDIKSPTLKKKADKMDEKLDKAEKRIAEEKQQEKEAEEKRIAEEKERAEKAKGSKDKYFEKANALHEKMLAERKELYGNSPPYGFDGQYSGEWQELLDEVYSTLKDIMPADEFKELEAEHQEWQKGVEEILAQYPDEPASSRGAATDMSVELDRDRTLYLIGTFME